jgi:hypothetical protein
LEKLIHERGGQCVNHFHPDLVTHVLVAVGADSNAKHAAAIDLAVAKGCPRVDVADIYRLASAPMPIVPPRKKYKSRKVGSADGVETDQAADSATPTATSSQSTTTNNNIDNNNNNNTTTSVTPEALRLLAQSIQRRSIVSTTTTTATTTTTTTTTSTPQSRARRLSSMSFLSPDSEAASMLSFGLTAPTTKRKRIITNK